MNQPPSWDYLSERNSLLPQVQVIWDEVSGLYRPVTTTDLTTINISGIQASITGVVINVGAVDISGVGENSGQLNVIDSGVRENTADILSEILGISSFQQTGISAATLATISALAGISGVAQESTLSSVSGLLSGVSYESGGLKVYVVNQSVTSLSNVNVTNSGLDVNARLQVPITLHSNGFVNQFTALNGSGTFLAVDGINDSESDLYIQLYDDIVPTGLPQQIIGAMGKTNFFIDYETRGLKMLSGITVAASTTPTGFTAPGTDSCYFTVSYLEI